MPKLILEFNLPEDKYEADLAIKAGDVSSALHEFEQWLRKRYKYPVIEDQSSAQELADIREAFYEHFSGLLGD